MMATEKRLIDANAFRKSINGWKLGKIPKGELLWDLDRQTTVDAVEVVHGRWVNPYINRYGHPCHCGSECGFKASYQDKNY